IAEFQSRKVEPICAQTAPEEAVAAMFQEAERFFGDNGCKAGCFVGNIALEMSDLDETFRQRVAGFFDDWAGGIKACLERCKERGYFGPTLDAQATAEALVALYEGTIMLGRSRRDAAVFGRVGKIARQILEQHKVRP
ncbi:MAG: TetR family transcriptional regulator C-terminal domain-containing protein, partial [Elusimicrobia bacterium]|nr:TetR family transcriptional regulator C-terminal domain-containing protein [Elusimicrobiota bacterium]